MGGARVFRWRVSPDIGILEWVCQREHKMTSLNEAFVWVKGNALDNLMQFPLGVFLFSYDRLSIDHTRRHEHCAPRK